MPSLLLAEELHVFFLTFSHVAGEDVAAVAPEDPFDSAFFVGALAFGVADLGAVLAITKEVLQSKMGTFTQ